jgi:hypothetical protein
MNSYKLRPLTLIGVLFCILITQLSCTTTDQGNRGASSSALNSGKGKFSEGNRMRRTGAYSSAHKWN